AEGDDLGSAHALRAGALLIDHVDEEVHSAATPLRVATAHELGAHRVPGQTAAVRPIGGHRVVAVRDRDHGDLERKLITLEPAWVAIPVVAFVVREDELGALEEFGDVAEQAMADLDMSLHLGALRVVERTLLQQYQIV